MSSETIKIICRSCRCDVEGPKDPKPQDTVRCPGCGTDDRYDVVIEKIKDQIAKKVSNDLLGGLANRTRNNGFIKVTHKPLGDDGYKFTFEYESGQTDFLS